MANSRVYRIVDLYVTIQKTKPVLALIEAYGIPATAGWKNIKLLPMKKKLSADGILDLEFAGKPPKKIIGQALPKFPVTASLEWDGDVSRLVGVRVVARTNEMARLLREKEVAAYFSAVNKVLPQTDDSGDGDGGPVITFGEGESAPTLGESEPTGVVEDPPTFFDDGETSPTLAEEKPTFGIEDIPSDAGAEDWPTLDEDAPTLDEDAPTGSEEPPTFAEQPPTEWETLPTIFPGEDGKHPINDIPPVPIPPTTLWYENIPEYPFPGPFNPRPFGQGLGAYPHKGHQATRAGRWVYRNGRWAYVLYKPQKKSAFGRR